MGQCVSVPQRKLSTMRENSTGCFYKSRPGNLSATFHVLDSSLRWDQLNVNTATEEQLMTLPTINRVIAENIIEYRQKIGGFKKVEDLALVSGVGATKLEQFRTEICVGRRKCNGSSYNSSLTQSMESLQTNEMSNRSSPMKLINLNTANVFQLMTICRMTQEMAAHIVHYRERKGPFKHVDDLLKVKGLKDFNDRLAVVKMYLTVDSGTDSSKNSSVNNGMNQNNLCVKQQLHRRTNSAPCGFSKSRSGDLNVSDLYDIISSQVQRPVLKEDFKFLRSGKKAMRIASWNLENFIIDKAKNPGVREVICRTILENGFSLVAVQEIVSKDALNLITTELNEPQLQNVKSWDGNRGKWRSILPPPVPASSPLYENSHKRAVLNGFLYDTSKGLQLRDSMVLHLPAEKLKALSISCQPFLVCFKIGNLEFVAANFNLVSIPSGSKILPDIMQLLKEKLPNEKNIFLMGNFVSLPGVSVSETLNSHGYGNLISSGTVTNVENQQEDSHVWATSNLQNMFTGQNGVVKEGLTHILIPKGWEWGGRVSDHIPIWTEIFAEEIVAHGGSAPLSNGSCKRATDQEPNEVAYGNKARGETHKKSHWGSNWVWKYSHKSGVSCEKNNIVANENGAV